MDLTQQSIVGDKFLLLCPVCVYNFADCGVKAPPVIGAFRGLGSLLRLIFNSSDHVTGFLVIFKRQNRMAIVPLKPLIYNLPHIIPADLKFPTEFDWHTKISFI